MKKLNLEKNMEEIFDLEVRKPKMEEKPPVVFKPNDDIDDDYVFARRNLRNIIESAEASIEELTSLAGQTESPRAYEVLATLMKTLVEANKDLLEIQKKVKDLRKEDEKPQPQNVTNALFVGSTSELQKFLKQQKDE